MTAAIGREELSERAVKAGWHRRDEGRTDYFSRSPVRIHVIWQGPDAISGGALLSRRQPDDLHPGLRHHHGLAETLIN